MADNQEQNEVTMSIFPSPPPFYKSFTRENQARLSQFKKDAEDSTGETIADQLSASQLLSLPPELRYLVPPAPPADDDEYRVFNAPTKGRGDDNFDTAVAGISNTLDATGMLKGWTYEQLFPSPPAGADASSQSEWTFDRQKYLLRFVRSILLNYVELLGILAVNPTSDDKDNKLKDILNLVANSHAIVNEYRPHQARETLIIKMEEQLERKKAEVERVRQMKEKVEETLAELSKSAPGPTTSAVAEADARVSPEEKRKETQRHMWLAMDELLGH